MLGDVKNILDDLFSGAPLFKQSLFPLTAS